MVQPSALPCRTNDSRSAEAREFGDEGAHGNHRFSSMVATPPPGTAAK